MKHGSLYKAIKLAWSRKTCYPKQQEQRELSSPSIGQCAVTALLIQDILGGDIVYCTHHNHYRNRLKNGKEIDLTKDQFLKGTMLCEDQIIERKQLLQSPKAIKAKTKQRYRLLSLFVKILMSHPTTNGS